MIIIADSGSTKTEWVILNYGKIISEVLTQGINPYFQDEKEIERIFHKELIPQLDFHLPNSHLELFYYGAGCSSPEKCAMVERPLKKIFANAQVSVEHDLLAAARALCGKEKGIAAILGTGSNSCLFDGEKIIANNPSLGFMLGDEGSGGHMGKELLKMFVYGELDSDIKKDFDETFHLTKEIILDTVYHKPNPNRYCASFMPFVGKHISEPQMAAMVRNSFVEFFKRHITKYGNFRSLPFSCVGTVALIFHDQLTEAADQFKVNIHKVLKNPMEGLVHFHAAQ
ncbi:MAG: hypothetical protein ACHQK8_08675 [Bacteroidia bacterium]